LAFALAILSIGMLRTLQAQQGGAPISFQRDVRPILSDNCFLCHGPDQSTRMVGLRLDIRDGVFSKRPNGVPIVPGKSEQSLLYQRILADNPARRMPPPSSHKTLTDKQKETLKRWIEEGANWNEHWSFVPPVQRTPPNVSDEDWSRNPIDRFILAKLEANRLTHAPEADRRSLIRRVSLDVRGLPPAPEEIAAFVDDRSPSAYEKMVDRLLASPRYGEHRAHYWLDAARYGDTNGMHYDNYRGGIWPYRDWVVNAFNRNLSYDQFAVEQLAGDLLPNPTIDQLIATGFSRNNVTTNENGVIEEEVAVMYAKDRADTTGAVFLGLTTGCATCHDHKFDPISQKDHYALEAFFNNTTQMIMDDNRPDAPPIIFVPNDPDRASWLALNRRRDALRAALDEARRANNPAFVRWISGEVAAIRPPVEESSELLGISMDEGVKIRKDGRVAEMPLRPGVTLGPSPWQDRQALLFDGKTALAMPDVKLTSDTPFAISFWVYLPKIVRHPGLTGARVASPVVASQLTRTAPASKLTGGGDPDAAAAEPELRGWLIDLDEGVPALKLYGDGSQVMRALALRNMPLQERTWTHLTFTYDGSRKEEGLSLYVNAVAAPIERGGFGVQNKNVVRRLPGTIANDAPLLLGSDGVTPVFDGSIADFRIFSRAITEEEARLVAAWPEVARSTGKTAAQLSSAQTDALRLYYLSFQDPNYGKRVKELDGVNAERKQIIERATTAMIMEERPNSKATARILYRGLYDQPRDEVEANVPSALPPLPASSPRNRLGLAKWLVDPGNPLTARVAVNRFWQELFGVGLVSTTGDFGAQGEAPSHPELLDWLAVEFRESGWNVKKLFRLILMSAAYRQSARASGDSLTKDRENRLVSRGPSFRLDGEVIRDLALSASGLLVSKMGGPPVKPYQPGGVWEATSMPASNTKNYQQDQGNDLYRRSLYTLWKRSAPPASMEIFDGPTRESCTVRRERTNTPLQALVMMNDPQFVEAARNLAGHAMSGKDLDARIDFMTIRLLARTFDSKERGIVGQSYNGFFRYYESHPDDAAKLVSVGESKADPKLPKSELAALTMVANQLISLDETLNK